METIGSLKNRPVGWCGLADLRLPEGSAQQGGAREFRNILAIHVPPATLLAGVSNGGNCHVGDTQRTRLDGAPYMAILSVQVADKLHLPVFPPGSKEFVSWARGINSRGYARICVYDLFGRFFVGRFKVLDGKLFESALEVHEASRAVSQEEFLHAVDFLNSCLKHGGLENCQWLPSDRSKILTAFAADLGKGKGC